MNEDAIGEEEKIAGERGGEGSAPGTPALDRPIRELATLEPPVCVGPETKLRRAIDAMNRGRSGCVLVVRAGKLVGIFTERDVVTRVVTEDVDIDKTRIDEVMTEAPETLSLDDSVAYVLNRMALGGFRHIPLVDSENRPVGVVARWNMVDYMVEIFHQAVLNLPPEPRASIPRAREGA